MKGLENRNKFYRSNRTKSINKIVKEPRYSATAKKAATDLLGPYKTIAINNDQSNRAKSIKF